MALSLARILRESLDAAEGDEEKAYNIVLTKLDEASTGSADIWYELDYWRNREPNWEAFLRDAIAKAAESWRRRRSRPWKPPPPAQ